MDKANLFDSRSMKIFMSPEYNYVFNKETGVFMRWGSEKQDNPNYSPFGPEIADIEISTICSGINDKPCSHCYKSNTKQGFNMDFSTFKKIFNNLPKTVTQIAFGIGDIDANPDLFKILIYTRVKGVIPNITINGVGLTNKYADELVKLCGAISISCYEEEDICYNAVRKLTERKHTQINIHSLISEETYKNNENLLDDRISDFRLNNLNAIVFLALKPKGNRNKLTPLKSLKKWQHLIDNAIENNIDIGFDSCSAPWVMESFKNHPDYYRYKQLIEPCESFLFSIYINVFGEVYPCSFLEESKYLSGNATKSKLIDIWTNPKASCFRQYLINYSSKNDCRECPVFDIYGDKR